MCPVQRFSRQASSLASNYLLKKIEMSMDFAQLIKYSGLHSWIALKYSAHAAGQNKLKLNNG